MDPRSLRFLRAVRVVARIATIAYDHSRLVTGVSTPHAGAVVRYLSNERSLLGGGRADSISAGRGERSELTALAWYETCVSFNGLGRQALVQRVVGQLPKAFRGLLLRLRQGNSPYVAGPLLAKHAGHARG